MKANYSPLLTILLTPALIAAGPNDGGTRPGAANPALSEAYGKLPMSFEAWTEPNSAVKFSSRGPGYNLSLTPAGAVLALQGGNQKSEVGSQKPKGKSLEPAVPSPESRVPTLLRMKLLGANAAPEISGLNELPGKVNYYLGNNRSKWRTGVPTYARVKYQNVYPGIDLEFYGNQRQLEYDFTVAPGANPQSIRLAFEGTEKIELNDQGNLVLRLADGEVVQRAPVIYQMADGARREISGRFARSGKDEISFLVGDYDPSLPLVIDPLVLGYSSYLGGSGSDIGYGIAVGSDGTVYVSGKTQSSNFPVLNSNQAFGGVTPIHCHINSPTGPYCSDAFVTRFSADGASLIFSTYLGGNLPDEGRAIAVDGSGNAYVTGYTEANDFPTLNALQSAPGGSDDAFIAKLSAAGALVYSSYLGGSYDDWGLGAAVDGSGNLYVTGNTRSDNFPTTAGVVEATSGSQYCHLHTPSYNHCYDGFVTKVNSAGSALVYSTYLGSSDNGDSQGNGITVDGSGAAYIAGETAGPNFPVTNGVVQTTIGPGICETTSLGEERPCPDAFLAKLSPDGTSLTYATYLGGTGREYGRGVALGTGGVAYLTGNTNSTDFPTASPLQAANGGLYDAFLAEFNSDATALTYSTYLGGTSNDVGFSVAANGSGEAYLTGYAQSSNFPTSNPVQPVLAGTTNTFTTKVNADGSALLYSTYLGGTTTDTAYGIALDGSGNAYIAGSAGADFPTTAGAFQTAGSSDAFVAKIVESESAENPTPALISISPSSILGQGPNFTLKVKGSGFVTASVVQWNGSPRTTTYINPSLLQAQILAADIASVGTANVTVVSPEPGGGTSNALTMEIYANPTPVLDPFYWNWTDPGSTNFSLEVYGSNFVVGSVVRWNGSDRVTTYGSATHLTATILGSDHSVIGPVQITVFNPPSGGGISNPQTYYIGNPIPIISYLSPSSVTVGDTSQTLYVNGSNFMSGTYPSVIRWNGVDRTTSYYNSNKVYMTLQSEDVATAGTASITVYTPGPGGGESSPLILTIDNPYPGIGSVSPDTAHAGGSDFTLTVNASASSAFVPSSVVRWGGSDRPTTFISSTQLHASISAADIAARKHVWVSVYTPPPGGGEVDYYYSVVGPGLDILEAIDMSPRVVGAAGSPRSVYLYNMGEEALILNSLNISGSQAAEFSMSHDCALSPESLASYGYCILNITFNPAAVGPRKAALMIASNMPRGTRRVMLTGLGTAVSLSMPIWNFGNQTVQTISTPRTATLSNLGGTPIHVWVAAISGANAGDFHQTNNCPATLAGGASCAFNVTFQPTALGTRNATLAVSHDGGNSPSQVSLTGNGTAAALKTVTTNTFVGNSIWLEQTGDSASSEQSASKKSSACKDDDKEECPDREP